MAVENAKYISCKWQVAKNARLYVLDPSTKKNCVKNVGAFTCVGYSTKFSDKNIGQGSSIEQPVIKLTIGNENYILAQVHYVDLKIKSVDCLEREEFQTGEVSSWRGIPYHIMYVYHSIHTYVIYCIVLYCMLYSCIVRL
jgi:hypothetical protein